MADVGRTKRLVLRGSSSLVGWPVTAAISQLGSERSSRSDLLVTGAADDYSPKTRSRASCAKPCATGMSPWPRRRTRLSRTGPSSPPPSTPPSSSAPAHGAECTAPASYSSAYNDYDVYIHSNEPDQSVTVTDAEGHPDRWHTDASGYAATSSQVDRPLGARSLHESAGPVARQCSETGRRAM